MGACIAPRSGVASVSLAAALLLASAALAQEKPVLDGWGPLRFGMSIDDARKATDLAWDPDACTDEKEIALDGCYLWPKAFGAGEVVIDGMGFSPGVRFDRWGRLQQIDLSFGVRRSAFESCQSLFERTVENLEQRYGQLQPVREPHASSDIAEGWIRQDYALQNGVTYHVASKGKTNRVSGRLSTDVAAFNEHIGPSERPSRPYITVNFGLVESSDGGAYCSIPISYHSAHMPPPTAAGDSNKFDF